MAEKVSRKLKRKSDQFYSEIEECEANEVKKKKSEDLSSQASSGDQTTPPNDRCDREFFDRSCEELARALLGCVLVRECGGEECRGMVVETEAYLGGEDRAAHSFNNHKSEWNAAMFMPPGTAYVYAIYGIHCCFNVSSQGKGAAVLVRALQPVSGEERMRQRRPAAKKTRDLCNGPAKLCQALSIDRSCDKLDLVTSRAVWVEPRGVGVATGDIASSGRIGVEYAGEEWSLKPLRFYIRDNQSVSKAKSTGKKH